MITPGKMSDLPLRIRAARRQRSGPRRTEQRFNALAFCAIIMMSIAWLLTGNHLMIPLIVFCALLMLWVFHISAALSKPDTVVILGHNSVAKLLTAMLTEKPLASRLPFQSPRHLHYRRISSVGEAEDVLKTARCEQVIVSESREMALAPMLTNWEGNPVRVVDGIGLLEKTLGRVPLEFLSTEAWYTSRVSRIPESVYHFLKRTSDIALAIIIGIIILPLIPLIALAIKLDSGGPVLYHQERVGLKSRIFHIHKFRTMCKDAERNGAVWAQIDDPRVTRLGRLLRRTRIDELPQVWNVIRGDMSFVGPRPERPQFTQFLEQEIPGYQLRNLVRPGLTGWAQVKFRYTSSLHDSRVKLEYDLYYLKHASLLLDIQILFRTVFVVLGMRGR